MFVCCGRFCVGDRFYLCENKILCEYDYEERLVFANMAYNPSSLAHIRRQVSSLQVCIPFLLNKLREIAETYPQCVYAFLFFFWLRGILGIWKIDVTFFGARCRYGFADTLHQESISKPHWIVYSGKYRWNMQKPMAFEWFEWNDVRSNEEWCDRTKNENATGQWGQCAFFRGH